MKTCKLLFSVLTVLLLASFVRTAQAKTDIQPAAVTLSWSTFTYTGLAVTPTVTSVVLGNKTLVEGTDYTVSFPNAAAAVGTYDVRIDGIGDYNGWVSNGGSPAIPPRYSIVAKNINDSDVEAYVIKTNTYTYTGSQITPGTGDIHIKYGILGPSYNITGYGTNINAGTGSLTIQGTGNYTGTKELTFTISPRNMSEVTITDNNASTGYDYTGGAITPSMTATYNGKTLSSPTDYSVTYAKNTNACLSTAADPPTATFTGAGNYTGTATKTFTINQIDINLSTVTATTTQDHYIYTTKAIEPEVTITYKANGSTITNTLVKGTDYSASYSNNVNAKLSTDTNPPTITLTGKGTNYKGTRVVTFTIEPKPVSADDVAVTQINGQNVTLDKDLMSDYKVTYDGRKFTPSVTLVYNGHTLTSTEYSLAYGDNTNANQKNNVKPSITITGIGGNYNVTKTIYFTIEPRDIGEAVASAKDGPFPYTGSKLSPKVDAVYNEMNLEEGSDKDYTLTYPTDNIEAGINGGTITLNGVGNYKNTLDVKFNIDKADFAGITATVTGTYTYTGKQIKPTTVTATYEGKTLTFDKDFTLSYGENINAGTAKGTVTLTSVSNDFSGSKTITFDIAQRDIAEASATASSGPFFYTGSQITPKVAATYNGLNLAETTDYALTYGENINVATGGTITLTGAGNYTGTKVISFAISKRYLTDAAVTAAVKAGTYTYTGSQITPKVDAAYNSTALTEGTDYTLTYGANVNAGTKAGSIKVNGTTNYTGTIDLTFDIAPKNLAEEDVTAAVAAGTYTFTGSQLTPKVDATYNTMKLAETTDYTLTYGANIHAGTNAGSIVMKGAGTNYIGQKTVYFDIAKRDISEAAVTATVDGGPFTYTGSKTEPTTTVIYNTMTLLANSDYTLTFANNINAGTATITVTGAGNDYTGTKELTFTIGPRPITDATIKVADGTYSFTGSAIEPKVVATYNSMTLVEGSDKDYTLGWANNTAAGTGNITVTGTGNYTGTTTLDFTIEKAEITATTITVIDAPFTYTGSAIEPKIKSMFNGAELVEGTDYTLTYGTSNTDAGTNTGVINVTGIGNYKGTTVINFTINPRDLATVTVTPEATSFVYTGNKISPKVTVKYGTYDLKDGIDYTVGYGANTNVGTGAGEILVTAAGKNFTGSQTVKFDITPKNIAEVALTITGDPFIYNGNQQTPGVSAVYNGTILSVGTDYDLVYGENIDAGQGTFTLTGKGNYNGTNTVSFDIAKRDIAEATATVLNTPILYTGSQLKPDINVRFNGKDLIAGTDFTIAYGTNTDAGNGAGSIILTGMGTNFKGTQTVNFDIVKEDVSDVTVTVVGAPFIYTGKEITPTVNATYKGTALTTSDYTLEYANNLNAGTATITFTASNFQIKRTLNFTIAKRDIAEVAASLEGAPFYFTGSQIKPEVTVAYNGMSLARGTDYTVVYGLNTNVGSNVGTVTLTGVGTNYTGTKTLMFDIKSTALQNAVVTLSSNTFLADGTQQKPEVSVTLNGETLVAGTDYTVSYGDNTNPGTGTVTITGKGKYSGEITVSFIIAAKVYKVLMPAVKNAKTNPAAGYITAEAGKPFTFTVTPDNGYKAVVSANGVVLTPTNGNQYTINNISADTNISIEVLKTTAAVNIDKLAVWSKDGNVFIASPENDQLTIVNIGGQIVARKTIPAGVTVATDLAHGVYIVKVGTTTTKVLVQ